MNRVPSAVSRARCAFFALLLAPIAACTPNANATLAARDGGAFDGGRQAALASDAGALALGDAAAPLATLDAGLVEPEIAPPTTSDDLGARAKHLVEAVAQDNPELATDILFPRDAWLTVRDGKDPARSWEKHVNAPFARQVHALHRRIKGLDRAQFVAVEIGHTLVQAVPSRKEWKRPLWRVRHSHITVSVDGKLERIELSELVGWKGAWYVTKIR